MRLVLPWLPLDLRYGLVVGLVDTKRKGDAMKVYFLLPMYSTPTLTAYCKRV